MDLGQNEQGRSERDEMNEGRNEWDVVYGTKSIGTKCMGAVFSYLTANQLMHKNTPGKEFTSSKSSYLW